MREFSESGYDHAHFFNNVVSIFYLSDLSIVNLEGALTDVTYPHMDKQFVFRGPPHFARILYYGNIDAVSLANNHTRDFFQRGYDDTRAALTYAGVAYFGNANRLIKEVNGINVGLFGHSIWHDGHDNRNRITRDINYLQNNGAQLIIAYFHWGVEGDNHANRTQIFMGRYAVRAGADLVLGAHPHVIQGIEEYRGRFIEYSLADFCFGGNATPPDQDTFIFQQTFTFYRGVLQPYNEKNIIPARMSSVRYRNNFQPTPAEGEDGERILARIAQYSAALQ
jgi:poly-gamma-glutamate synthesis protein (capsule biosynthesis protein)